MEAENKDKILAKLALIMGEVAYIQKDAENKHQRYNYASERAIKEHVGKALRANGVVFQMSQGLPVTIGSVLIVPIEYTFWDSESGQSISGTFNGAGHLRDDKGFYAAVTGAIKYIFTSTFVIATGDDPEDDRNEEPEPKHNPKPEHDQKPYLKKDELIRRIDKLEELVCDSPDQADLAREKYLGTTELAKAKVPDLAAYVERMENHRKIQEAK